MRGFGVLAVLGLAILASGVGRAAETAATTKAAELKVEFAFQKKGDAGEIAVEGGRVVLTVKSGGGIGSMKVKVTQGAWPKEVVVRMTYTDGKGFTNLESVSATCGRMVAAGDLKSSGHFQLLLLNAEGQPKEAGTIAVKVVATEKGLEVRLPEAFVVGGEDLKVGWIDAFR